jgi:hypothetical protein
MKKEQDSLKIAVLEELIDSFVAKLQCLAPETAVSFSLAFSYDKIEYSFKRWTAESLKARGISAQNLRGDLIK